MESNSPQLSANSQLCLAYMRCAILAARPSDIAAWDIETVRGVFHLMPRPPVDFLEWQRRMTGTEAGDADRANAQFIAFAQKSRDAGAAIEIVENTNGASQS